MKYWKARQLSSKKFKRKTGISPRTYRIMVRLVKDKEAGKKKPGRPSELIIENQVLVALEYWREYRSYYHIARLLGSIRIDSLSHGSQNRKYLNSLGKI